MQSYFNINTLGPQTNDISNKRRKIDNFICNNISNNQDISINQYNFINELEKCNTVDKLGEFISNDYRLFYSKEQTIFIINKILQLQKNNNFDSCYYS